MPVHEFIQNIWATEYYAENLHVCLIIITTTSQIYKSWSLHDSSSTKTRTGACITQNQIGTERPATTFKSLGPILDYVL